MLPALDSLRELLVERWGLLTSEQWVKLTSASSDPATIIDRLRKSIRFPRYHQSLSWLPSHLQKALESEGKIDPVQLIGNARWLKLHLLDKGGQGEVWIACPCDPQARPDDLVALKIPKHTGSAAEQRARLTHLQREIQILRQVRVETLVRLVDADDGVGVFATRLVDGLDLESLLEKSLRLFVWVTVRVGIDVCHALEALHSLQWIHKDVKPGNIVLEKGEHAILIDLGLAEAPKRTPVTTAGTYYYMAPEVFEGKVEPDQRADVYSLAATLFRLLVGLPPHFQRCLHPRIHRSERSALDMERFLRADPTIDCDLELLRRDVPPALSRLICQALSVDRDRRPPSAEAFRQSLEAIQQQLDEAKAIEQAMWNLSNVLLKIVEDVYKDPVYAGMESRNAKKLLKDLDDTLRRFKLLEGLEEKEAKWCGVPALGSLLIETSRIVRHLNALARQLRAFLANPDTSVARVELLKELIVRTLEGIRTAR
jgi:serine/threonine protein kinase